LSKIKCSLQDPFPVERLASVNLGSMDGHRDPLVEKGFIQTKSVNKFLQDRHAIIIGPFGSGKSALFNLLRNKSDLFKKYQNDLIVTIDEQIQFEELREASKTYFPNLSEGLSFQLLWKFQVCRRISEELAKLDRFPFNDEEKYISEFIARTGGIGGYLSITSRIKQLFEKVSLKIKTKLSDIPVDVELSKETEKATKRVYLNLDEVVTKAVHIIKSRSIRKCTVIIDKLDKFVAGEDYGTQRAYIESLIKLEDDLYGLDQIGFKIFIRSDLYERLDFSALGPDKVEDNTLRLVWSKEEIRKFLARRLFISIHEIGVWNIRDIIDSSDISEYHLRWYEKVILDDEKNSIKYKLAHLYNKNFGRKRNKTSFFEKIDLIVINKLFEKNLVHECPNGTEKLIQNHEFFDTHFLDGNDSCTPRYILVFLKELIDEANEYYLNSPDVFVTPVLSGSDWVYNLFSQHIAYRAYIQSKEKYIRHVSKVDDRWTSQIMEFLEKQGNKGTFDYKWIRSNISFQEDERTNSLTLLIYLQVIGFLRVKQYSPDIRKRTFEMPVLYKSARGSVRC